MIVVGIDPGSKGAIATCSAGPINSTPSVRIIPTVNMGKKKKKMVMDEPGVRDFLEKRKRAIQQVFIEKVGAMPDQGRTSIFNFGTGWGILRGICVGLHISYTLVTPQKWKGVMCAGLSDDEKDKGASIIVAKRLWPDVSLLPTPRCKKDSDGLADALCIAEYGRRILMGGST